MIKQLTTALFALSIAGMHSVCAQNSQGFIYGKITTIDNDVYEGPIRWGKEEVYWTDIFNAGKRNNDNLEFLSRREIDDLERQGRRESWGLVRWNWDWDYDNDFKHQFGCQFGNIKKIVVTGRNRIDVELQNGEEIRLDGDGYNDVGTKVKVIDNDLGEVEMKWSRIDQIEFLNTPSQMKQRFGNPLYGVVETRGEKFKGFVQWDHDERVDTDKLDGDSRDGDMSIAFERIKSIERDGNGSTVILNSGRELYLRGTNDVDYDNKGIIVTTEFGRVDIEWREFVKVTFEEAKGSGPGYDSFKKQAELIGEVITENGKNLKGRLVYDLDEAYNFEILNGEDDDEIEYLIPFDQIASITPKGYDESDVVLKSGKKFRLQEGQDVSDNNTGILVFEKNERDPIYVPWDEVREVKFN